MYEGVSDIRLFLKCIIERKNKHISSKGNAINLLSA